MNINSDLRAWATEHRRRTIQLNLKYACIPQIKRLEDFDFASRPSMVRRLIDELATGRFLRK